VAGLPLRAWSVPRTGTWTTEIVSASDEQARRRRRRRSLGTLPPPELRRILQAMPAEQDETTMYPCMATPPHARRIYAPEDDPQPKQRVPSRYSWRRLVFGERHLRSAVDIEPHQSD
jgi:hypothetical protein